MLITVDLTTWAAINVRKQKVQNKNLSKPQNLKESGQSFGRLAYHHPIVHHQGGCLAQGSATEPNPLERLGGCRTWGSARWQRRSTGNSGKRGRTWCVSREGSAWELPGSWSCRCGSNPEHGQTIWHAMWDSKQKSWLKQWLTKNGSTWFCVGVLCEDWKQDNWPKQWSKKSKHLILCWCMLWLPFSFRFSYGCTRYLW